MIRKRLYPKTTRLGKDKVEVKITEKLDGSNLTFFKHPERGTSVSYYYYRVCHCGRGNCQF